MGVTGWIILGVIAVIALLAIVIYNRLVALRQTVNQSWSDISVQLKQRHDLVPNLVEAVKATPPTSAARLTQWSRHETPPSRRVDPKHRQRPRTCSPARSASFSRWPKPIPT